VKVKVKLFGTLGQNISGYRQLQEIEYEMPDGVTAEDLLARIGIPVVPGVTIITEGRVLKSDDVIQDGALLNVMQAIRGGGPSSLDWL
jgi:sulfur carrier protein ThiS